jgi:hypothetical protein
MAGSGYGEGRDSFRKFLLPVDVVDESEAERGQARRMGIRVTGTIDLKAEACSRSIP